MRGRVIGGAMLAGVPVMLWQETVLNTQALAWCVVVAVMALGAIKGPFQSSGGAAEPTNATTDNAAPGAP